MEFVQFYPYRIYLPKRADIFPDLFDHGAVLRNEKGERFMDCDRYPMKELENRDVVARAEFAEKGSSARSFRLRQKAFSARVPQHRAHGARYPDKPLLIRPVAHFMGGVPLRTDCSTYVVRFMPAARSPAGCTGRTVSPGAR